MSDVKSASVVHSVQHNHSKFSRNRHRSKSHAAVNNDADKWENCGQQHEPKQCPAYDQKCGSCRRRGHFARCCRKLNRRQRSSSSSHITASTFNPTHSVDLLEDGVETLFVSELLSINSLSQKRAAFRDVVVNNTPISVTLDTGAECCVMTLKTYNTIPARPKLVPTGMLIKV